MKKLQILPQQSAYHEKGVRQEHETDSTDEDGKKEQPEKLRNWSSGTKEE